jgi:uncharacterized protein (DUF58 family)
MRLAPSITYNAGMPGIQQYVRPEVIRQVSRLDLRAKFIVQGFLAGLHASPFHGFSVEFSEHRNYVPGDDLKYIDWNVYAKTGKFYVKKFQAETNMTGYLVMDLSESMGWTFRQEMTKFEYGICLAAALGYLMIHQQDPVGLVTFDTEIREAVPPRSKRTQLGTILAVLSSLRPTGPTNIEQALTQVSALARGKSLIMLFSDLLTDLEPVLNGIHLLRHRGHEVILFHILDEAEVRFPFDGLTEFEDVESAERLTLDARAIKSDYLQALDEHCRRLRDEAARIDVDYVGMDTSVGFDKALLEYLIQRQRRF